MRQRNFKYALFILISAKIQHVSLVRLQVCCHMPKSGFDDAMTSQDLFDERVRGHPADSIGETKEGFPAVRSHTTNV